MIVATAPFTFKDARSRVHFSRRFRLIGAGRLLAKDFALSNEAGLARYNMTTKLIQFAGKFGITCAVMLALSPVALADEYSTVIPAHVLERGSAFVLETVIRNVQTGEREVVTEECVPRPGPVPAFDCIQINPDPAGATVARYVWRPPH